MKIQLFLLGLLFYSASSFAQLPSIEWERTYDQYDATSPQGSFTYNTIDNNGNIYTFGKFSDTKDFDASTAVFNLTAAGAVSNYITKYDTNGNFIWAKTFGAIGTENLDRPQAITVDNAGNVYTTGTFTGTNDFDPSVNVAAISGTGFILKLDTDGNFVWVRPLGGKGYGVKVDSNNNVLVCTESPDPTFNFGTNTAAVLKFDSAGSLLWKRNFSVEFFNNAFANEIAVDSNNNIVVKGIFSGTIDLDPTPAVVNFTSSGAKDFFIIKLDTEGNLIFGNKIGGNYDDISQGLTLDNVGNIYLNGTYSGIVDFDPSSLVNNLNPTSQAFYADSFILKLNALGEFVWAKSVPSPIANADYPYDIQIDNENNVYAIGVFQEDGNAPVDFDPNTGVYELLGGISGDSYFLKLNQNGDLKWAFTGASLGITHKDLRSLAIDNNGQLIIARTGYLAKLNQPESLSVVNSKKDSRFSIYPNPTASFLNLNSSLNLENASLKIISLMGQTVLEKQNLSGLDFSFDVASLSAGLYIFEIRDDKNFFKSKFVKQ